MVPTTSSVGALTDGEAERRPDPHHHADDQGPSSTRSSTPTAGNYEATYAVDNTAPTISNVAASAPGDGTADVTWDTERGLRPRRWTTAPIRAALNQHQSSPGLVTSHSVQLTGLAPNTTYHYRVTSADAVTPMPNSSTSPEPPAAPRSFTTPSATFTDTTVSDFGAGTPDANTYVSETGNGEVTLKPAEGQEFSGGPGLPAGWSSCVWPADPVRRRPVARHRLGRRLHVDGGFAGTDATFGPGHSLEFDATFGAATFQHVAFTDNFTSAWAMFSTRGTTSQLSRQHQHRRRCRRHPDRRSWPVRRLRSTSTGSNGTRARSSTTSTATWCTPPAPPSDPT